MTHSSGQLRMPTPTKASMPNNHGRHCRGTTFANLITVARSSPAAGVRALHLWQGDVFLVQYDHADYHQTWPAQEPGDGRRGARPAGETIPDHHRQIEHVRPGQKLSERQEVDELPLSEPALLFHQPASRPENRAAEGGQANPRKGEEQLEPADPQLV